MGKTETKKSNRKKTTTKKVSSMTFTNSTSVLILAVIVLLFIMMSTYWVSKGTFSAGTDSVSLNCPSSGAAGATVSCTVSLTASSGTILSVNANYDFSSGVNYSSFTASSDFEALATTQNGFAVGNVDGVTGSVNVGTLKVILPSTAGNSTIKLINVELSNSDFAMIELSAATDTITVTGSGGGGSETPTAQPVIDEDNSIIKRISFGTTPSQINSLITGNVTGTSGGQAVASDAVLKTGDTATVISSGSTKTYTISVLGDVSPDGEIDIDDVAILYRHYRNRVTLTEPFIAAGEITKDGEIDIDDVANLYRYYRGRINSLEVAG